MSFVGICSTNGRAHGIQEVVYQRMDNSGFHSATATELGVNNSKAGDTHHQNTTAQKVEALTRTTL
ncbi:MAG TPA: hypothetical protein DEF45_05270 [Rhodopirellula sp.]|nr:hypothetical protein [Rhodopirellula sp.]